MTEEEHGRCPPVEKLEDAPQIRAVAGPGRVIVAIVGCAELSRTRAISALQPGRDCANTLYLILREIIF